MTFFVKKTKKKKKRTDRNMIYSLCNLFIKEENVENVGNKKKLDKSANNYVDDLLNFTNSIHISTVKFSKFKVWW